MIGGDISSILWQFVKEYPFLTTLNICFALLVPVQDILLPHLYGNVISAIEKSSNIIKPFVIVITVLAFLQIMAMVSDWHDTKLFPRLDNFIRSSIFKNILLSYETNYQDLVLGKIMSKLNKIPPHIILIFEKLKNYIIPYMLTFVIAIIYFLLKDRTLGLTLAFLLISFAVLVVGSPLYCKKTSIQRDNSLSELYEEIDDSLRNSLSIYGQNQIHEEIQRLKPYEKRYEQLFSKTMMCALNSRLYTLPITIGFLTVFVIRSYHMIQTKRLKASNFIPLFIILLYMLNAMVTLTDHSRDLIFEMGIVNTTADMFGKQSPTTQNFNYETNIPTSGILIKDVSFAYKQPILQGFNLYIPLGQKIALVGSIGSGKSTILKLLLKLHKPSKGEIYINGAPFSKLTTSAIRKHIGYVPQTPILFNRTIMENICYGNKHVNEEFVTYMMKELGLYEELGPISHTKVGKNGSNISGGQRQLVWTLRVLLKNPDIVILDEPTSALDEKSKQLFIKLLNKLIYNKTVIIVTHDDTLMRYANRKVTLDKGIIVKDENIT